MYKLHNGVEHDMSMINKELKLKNLKQFFLKLLFVKYLYS